MTKHFKTGQIAGIVLGLFAALFWSCLNVILKHKVGNGLHPTVVNSGLFFSALTVLIPLSLVLWKKHENSLPIHHVPIPPMIACAARSGGALAYVYAVQHISATQTTIYTKLNTVWMCVILFFIDRNKVNGLSVFGSILSFAGVYITLDGLGGLATLDRGIILGSAIAILAGALYAIFSISLKRGASETMPTNLAYRIRFTASITGVCLLMTLPFAVIFYPRQIPGLDVITWIWIGGAVFNALAYLLYYYCLMLVSELLAVIILSLTIPFTLIIEVMLFNVEIPPSLLVGAMVIICGILCVSKATAQAPAPQVS